MCGIAGFVTAEPADPQELEARVRRMIDAIAHRGPDDSGAWVDAESGVGLGSRRLAIVDLSPAGHQPMLSSSERYVIAFNGEVYNFACLRQELEPRGHKFRGHSDTEVILAAVSEWGLQPAVTRFVGMFAIALWDRQERVLHLVRDRLGIKPVYYAWAGRAFLFGSELKALRAYPGFSPAVHRDALTLQLRYSYIPQPHTIYQKTFKLPPGCILSLAARDSMNPAEAKIGEYWSAKEVAERGAANPFEGSEAEAIEQVDKLLREAVELRMIADVPLGAFLSGGIDSSTVVALMQAASSRPVKTFTIGFAESEFNEAEHAGAVARHLGTDHTELYVSPEETRAVIPKLPEMYDEPFSDSSQIPTFLVSELARRHVTVSLSGDGGDELFGGYPRYFLARDLWRRIGWIPRPLRRLAAGWISGSTTAGLNRRWGWLSRWTDSYGRPASAGEKLQKLAQLMTAASRESLYQAFVSHVKEPTNLVLGSKEPAATLTDPSQWARLADYSREMMFFDLVTYLPDDILAKVDRASMAVSLEARVPVLDHRVVEFTARLPLSMKIRNGKGKWLLRQVLYRYVPQELIERPKMGFSVPIDSWLRGPLRPWAEALIDPARLKREGYLNPEPIARIWAEHLAGDRRWGDLLWDVLMFQAWRERWA